VGSGTLAGQTLLLERCDTEKVVRDAVASERVSPLLFPDI
jgi:hypothetical protein